MDPIPGRPPTAADLLADEPTPFRWRLGVRPLDLRDWLLIDDHYDDEMIEIRSLIDRHHTSVFALPGSTDAAAEVRAVMVDHLRVRYPNRFHDLDDDELAEDPMPLAVSRSLVQEDLCLLQRADAGWLMTAGAVVIPTAWDVESKIGQRLDRIHSPVPRANDELATPMARFFDRLRVDRPVWRANRSLTEDGSLRLEPGHRGEHANPDITANNVAEHLWLRVEYQTLRRFPVHGSILFTIRILRQRLDSLADRPDLLRELVRSIEVIPPDVAAYKRSTTRHLEPLRTWVGGLSGTA